MPDINADFRQPAWLAPDDFRWVDSPQAGVTRVMLDRVGDEVALATSLVRYAPDSHFPPHEHGMGEEYLVLEGEFGDEHGRYPAGTYVRNPPGTRHAPFSEPGCVIWVKLRQFHPQDQRQMSASVHMPIPSAGRSVTVLHDFRGESVSVVAAAAGAESTWAPAPVVQELFVIDGAVSWRGRNLAARGWLRVPAGQGIELRTASAARLLHKTRPAFALGAVNPATSAASAGT